MVATGTAENGCERLILATETDPDMARLLSAWPILSAVVIVNELMEKFPGDVLRVCRTFDAEWKEFLAAEKL